WDLRAVQHSLEHESVRRRLAVRELRTPGAIIQLPQYEGALAHVDLRDVHQVRLVQARDLEHGRLKLEETRIEGGPQPVVSVAHERRLGHPARQDFLNHSDALHGWPCGPPAVDP